MSPHATARLFAFLFVLFGRLVRVLPWIFPASLGLSLVLFLLPAMPIWVALIPFTLALLVLAMSVAAHILLVYPLNPVFFANDDLDHVQWLQSLGRDEDAEALLSAALDTFPASVILHAERSRVRARLGDNLGALQDAMLAGENISGFQKHLKSPDGDTSRGRLILRLAGDPIRAVELMQRLARARRLFWVLLERIRRGS